MAKIGIFKKIAALATVVAIVLCFAVTASAAVSVTTTTSYLSGNEGDIVVNVEIAGEEIVGKSVSYYAFNNAGPVYIDQIEDGTAEIAFDYVTTSANLNSDVKIGYTGASEAEDATVDAYSVTWGTAVEYVPNGETEATVTFATEATSIVSIEAEGADYVSHVLTPGESLVVVLEHIEGDVTLTVTEGAASAIVELIDAAFLISDGHDDTLEAIANTKAGDRKLTAIGKVKNADVFGIIVSESSVAEGYTADEKYQAIANNGTIDGMTANGFYAIQIIDDTAEKTYLDDAKAYYVAAYGDDTVSEEKEVTARQQVVID